MKGTVKFFNTMKGFGFVTGDDGKEYFVHSSALGEGVSLQENDKISFDVEQGDRGPKAVNVVKGDGGASAADDDSTDDSDDYSDKDDE